MKQIKILALVFAVLSSSILCGTNTSTNKSAKAQTKITKKKIDKNLLNRLLSNRYENERQKLYEEMKAGVYDIDLKMFIIIAHGIDRSSVNIFEDVRDRYTNDFEDLGIEVASSTIEPDKDTVTALNIMLKVFVFYYDIHKTYYCNVYNDRSDKNKRIERDLRNAIAKYVQLFDPHNLAKSLMYDFIDYDTAKIITDHLVRLIKDGKYKPEYKAISCIAKSRAINAEQSQEVLASIKNCNDIKCVLQRCLAVRSTGYKQLKELFERLSYESNEIDAAMYVMSLFNSYEDRVKSLSDAFSKINITVNSDKLRKLAQDILVASIYKLDMDQLMCMLSHKYFAFVMFVSSLCNKFLTMKSLS